MSDAGVTIEKLWICPPLAFARFGELDEPMVAPTRLADPEEVQPKSRSTPSSVTRFVASDWAVSAQRLSTARHSGDRSAADHDLPG